MTSPLVDEILADELTTFEPVPLSVTTGLSALSGSPSRRITAAPDQAIFLGLALEKRPLLEPGLDSAWLLAAYWATLDSTLGVSSGPKPKVTPTRLSPSPLRL